MTGVEVLSKVRALSPRTVRILLTGYADLDAVEGSINESEVFRFLTKPCAPKQLRETIELAAKLAREAPAPQAPRGSVAGGHARNRYGERHGNRDRPGAHRALPDAAPAAERASRARLDRPPSSPRRAFGRPQTRVRRAGAPRSSRPASASSCSRVTTRFSRRCRRPCAAGCPSISAGNIVHVVKILDEHRPGVLVTDVSDDKTTIQAMTARSKEHVPQLVTIAVSQHRDVLDMVWLINHGQIFRFLRKPLSAGRCAISLQAALQHHRMLLKNPDLVKRHEVDAPRPTRPRRRRAREAQEHQAFVGMTYEPTNPQRNDAGRQSDLAFWVAGGVVAAVSVAWLLISQPWSDPAMTAR